MPNQHHVHPAPIQLSEIATAVREKQELVFSKEAKQAVDACRLYLDQKLAATDEAFYGINTGFGSLCDVQIPPSGIEELQSNLVQSHAAGMGDEVPDFLVRMMLFLKVRNLSLGHSGVRYELVERLAAFYNADLLPIIYTQGSLGASGDLAPLAHLSLPLLGLGKVRFQGKEMLAATALKKLNLKPLPLKAKEGLALLNGTQFSASYAVWCALKGFKLLELANMCAALSADGFLCRRSPFDARIHQVRRQTGQQEVAKSVRKWLENSPLGEVVRPAVQDPYAFRCVPQVHGATYDTLQHVQHVVENEVNAVTDNPLLFPEDDAILSGGNFHAQPLALVLDFLAIALSELGSISERRTYQLISGLRGLPAFLIADPGLHSGLMIPQYTAASIASQNKQLCTPASVDSIVSSNGQEDHVSMAANAATKCLQVVNNVERILAIEFMTACQALDFRAPYATSPQLQRYVDGYRKMVPSLTEDRVLSDDMHAAVDYLKTIRFDGAEG